MLGRMEIGVLGSTGPLGQGLAARLADVGQTVRAGSRDRTRAEKIVGELRDRWGDRVATLQPATNDEAAQAADLVVVATNWEAALETTAAHAAALRGKVVLTVANGLERVGREFRAVMPPEGSLAQGIQALVPDARVVAAFQHVPADALHDLDTRLESDVIVCADDDDARRLVLGLVVSLPNLRAFDGGSLANAAGLEAFAAVLLSVNVRQKGKGTLRLLGVEGYTP